MMNLLAPLKCLPYVLYPFNMVDYLLLQLNALFMSNTCATICSDVEILKLESVWLLNIGEICASKLAR